VGGAIVVYGNAFLLSVVDEYATELLECKSVFVFEFYGYACGRVDEYARTFGFEPYGRLSA
jgi:hypothetical protein